MKTNAIVRIILFSLAIVILASILFIGIGLRIYSIDFSNFVLTTEVGAEMTDGTVGNTGSLPASQIRELEIDWVAGSITIVPDEKTDKITFCEYGNDDPDHQMIWKQSGDTLSIQYEKSRVYFGIQVNSIVKDLVITVPADWVCDSLEIDAASAEVNVENLTLNEVDFDGASGICTFENCIVNEMDMDTASGDIIYSGELDSLSISAMSANCEITLYNVPRQIDLDSMSGDLDLTLPEDCGFTVSMDAMSSDFYSDFKTTSSKGHHVHGDGRCRIDIDAMSGDVSIHKGSNDHHPDLHHS